MKNLPYKFLAPVIFSLTFGCATQEIANLDEEINAIENGLMTAIVIEGDTLPNFSIHDRMKHYSVPGVSIAIVREGKVRWAKGYGFAKTNNKTLVDTNTLFQAGSISKPIAALAALKLMEENKVDLDADVNSYLDGWKVAENEFTKQEKVTLRRLLTHTAGTTVHGFPGYKQSDIFPSIEQVLNGNGNTSRIYVDTVPGSIWRYSGGGYTIMEKVVEEVSGLPLEEYLQENIFTALSMKNSTFEQPLPNSYRANASAAYDSEGKLIDGLWHNYPEQAAAGLWTTPTDLAKYCIEVQEILAGKSDGILSKATIEQMLTKHKNEWGLGPSLTWDGDSLRFQHGGKNAGFTNNMIAFAHKGDAVIIMTNADNGGKLVNELLRSVSKYYDWNISNPKTIKIVTLAPKQLDKYAGRYKYDEQVPNIGDYFIDISRENDKLVMSDPNNGQRYVITSMDSLRFIDLKEGDEVVFQTSSDSIVFNWNGRFRFHKVN